MRSANLAPWRSAHGGSDQLLRKWSKRRARRCSRLFRSSTTRRSDFKALFIVTNVIAWTYLLHAFYRKKGIDYRQFRPAGKRRRFLKTKFGATRRLSLDECLASVACPLDDIVKKNLLFLIGIRYEIEHQMTSRIDDQLSAKFQAAALNFNATIKRLFGVRYSLDTEQAFSIQLSGIDEGTAKDLMTEPDLPHHIRSFVVQFEGGLSQEEYDDPRFLLPSGFRTEDNWQ